MKPKMFANGNVLAQIVRLGELGLWILIYAIQTTNVIEDPVDTMFE